MKRQFGNRASLTLALGLESARNKAGVTKIALATKAHSSPQNIALIEERRTNPAQSLIAKLAAELGKTPADLYLLGELKLEEDLVAVAREQRLLVRRQGDLKAILETLSQLEAEDLQTIVTAAEKLSKDTAESGIVTDSCGNTTDS